VRTEVLIFFGLGIRLLLYFFGYFSTKEPVAHMVDHGCRCHEPSDVRLALPRCHEPRECKKVLRRIGP
jgi:hypothetical protein